MERSDEVRFSESFDGTALRSFCCQAGLLTSSFNAEASRGGRFLQHSASDIGSFAMIRAGADYRTGRQKI